MMSVERIPITSRMSRATPSAGTHRQKPSASPATSSATSHVLHHAAKRSRTSRGPWRSFEAVEFATLERVDWFNNRRLLEPIGNIPSAEAKERYYALLKRPANHLPAFAVIEGIVHPL